MVSWNLPARLVGRKISLDTSDGSCQQDNVMTPTKDSATRKKFRFDLAKSTVHDHYCLKELSDEEFRNMWITAEEFMASKKEYVSVVRMMMTTIGNFPETEDVCPRGLEFKTKDGSRRRKRTKQRACYAVLEEQDIQRDEGVCDPDFLADVYKEVTAQSSLEALNRGLKDQKNMLDLLDENDRSHREEQWGRKVGNSVLDAPLRRRSITETLKGTDLLHQRRTVPA